MEKELNERINLIISGVKIIKSNKDLFGNLFLTDKNIYFITTKIKNLPPAYMGGLIGTIIHQLTNESKTFEKTSDIPFDALIGQIEGSFKIELLNILIIRINNKNNHFVLKTKNNNQWSYNFFVATSEDREKLQKIFNKNNIQFEPTKGFFKTLIEVYKENGK